MKRLQEECKIRESSTHALTYKLEDFVMLAPKDSVKLKNRRERQSPGKAEEIPRKEKEVSAKTNWDTIAGSSFQNHMTKKGC